MPKRTAKELRVYAEENRLLAAHRRAEAALYENTAREVDAGIDYETDEFLRLNDAVIEAENRLPKRFQED
ncbi:hypothetical protein [Streptomyces sp. NRRL F-5135]|uniref:hypothetical protein n=1 Tax=Streptomyces sp. NRRL F-5135 TaxID=1463858 RepID=UPI0004CBDE17|nr:hypothetical protein [Streptomyces sp. NRRL F-5135]